MLDKLPTFIFQYAEDTIFSSKFQPIVIFKAASTHTALLTS
jgi:hypothetical protein